MALKWRLCALLFLATTLNYLDRQTVSILAPTLQKDLNLDNTALGWLFAVFYYAYTFSQVIVGPLMDRFHLRWAFGMAVVLWSAVSIATGLATGFVGLVVFRLLLGIAATEDSGGARKRNLRALFCLHDAPLRLRTVHDDRAGHRGNGCGEDRVVHRLGSTRHADAGGRIAGVCRAPARRRVLRR
jgi:hypothetical protein